MISAQASAPCLRPLLDVNQSWAALELGTHRDNGATTLALAATLLARDMEQTPPGRLPWLITLDAGETGRLGELAGNSPLARQLSAERVSFFLPAEAWESPAAAEQRRALESRGYALGADVADAETLERRAAAGARLLRIDSATARDKISPVLLNRLRDNGCTLVARNVVNHDLFIWCAARGFALMTGEFVPQPDECPSSPADPTKLRLLKLLSLIVQDADNREIEEMIKQEPKLSYNLLRLVNSVSVGASTKITSFSQAITLLGRRQLQRWLQLLIYANQFNPGPQANPLMPQAALRGRLVELIAIQALPDSAADADLRDCAYMTGAFSLLDVLLGLPLDSILSALPLIQEVADALGQHSGLLGEALALVECLERGEAPPDGRSTLRLTPEDLGRLQVDALAWASHINLA
ncbi:hypothetical protein AZSI13_23570 [Azospira sp. I13]|uniref:EAL and HDOD domain-containing protein n=1 Tax=Azospira sp. I13 TaxID=1765050 RepID=UPI000D4B6121|nr:HDOD domain-containing protein [Azospira sp. I13]GBG03030.1 hypothetical protein AZSI13_23570 [Azospira sp. I13]